MDDTTKKVDDNTKKVIAGAAITSAAAIATNAAIQAVAEHNEVIRETAKSAQNLLNADVIIPEVMTFFKESSLGQEAAKVAQETPGLIHQWIEDHGPEIVEAAKEIVKEIVKAFFQ